MALPLHKEEGSGMVSLLELFRQNAINTRMLIFIYMYAYFMLCGDTLTGCTHKVRVRGRVRCRIRVRV